MPTAKSAFTIEGRDETPAEWDGGSMSRARWTKTFTGDLSGTSTVELILARLATGASVYVGVERFDVALDGRKGGFVLMHSATMLDEAHDSAWTIVPGSGDGELAGITGRGEILPNHDFLLHYDLDA
jgi:hypothetical protein